MTLQEQDLTENDLPPAVQVHRGSGAGGAYSSLLTVTLDDGTVLNDDAAHAFLYPNGQ